MVTKPVIGSCRDCHHYGWLAYRWVCSACQAWNRKHLCEECASCGRAGVAVSKRHCRACWKEASHRAGPLNTQPLFTMGTTFTSHQLALAGVLRRSPPGVRAPRPHRRSEDPVSTKAAADEGQLALFPAPRAPAVLPPRRSAGGGKLKLGTFWTLETVDRHAWAHGWSPAMRLRARRTLIAALNPRPVGERVTRAELRACGGPEYLLAPVLADLDLLDEDPAHDPLARLIEKRTAGLPDGMRRDVSAWMTVLRDGDVRTRPRSWKTVVEYSRNVRPLLLVWARRHQDLREITRTDVQHALAAVPAGSARQNTFVAIRAAFRFLHRDRRIFTNPTSRLHQGRRHEPPVLPLTEQDYQRVTALATTELHRVVLLLVAVHGARPHMLRQLRLADVDLVRRRLTIAGVTRELDDLGHRVLTDWLRHRRNRWPLSANPHLLVSRISAHGVQPISDTQLKDLFRGGGVTLDRLRMDRHLEEALAYGPDPLHLAALFGISEATAIRYARQARLLLGQCIAAEATEPH